jgi:hypothetical protein
LPGQKGSQPPTVDFSIFDSRIQARPLALKLLGLAQPGKGRYPTFADERVQQVEHGISPGGHSVLIDGLTEFD